MHFKYKSYLLELVQNLHYLLASSPGHSQILSYSRGEKLGEGLRSLLCHRPEMVDSVSTNWVHITYWPSPPFPIRDVTMFLCLLLIFPYSCEIKSGSGLGVRLLSQILASTLPLSVCAPENPNLNRQHSLILFLLFFSPGCFNVASCAGEAGSLQSCVALTKRFPLVNVCKHHNKTFVYITGRIYKYHDMLVSCHLWQ